MSLRPRGRPPLESRPTKSVNVHLRLAASEYDAMYAEARAARVTIPQWIRQRLRTAPRPKD